MDSELKKAQEAIAMLRELDLPIGEEQQKALFELEKNYLEKEVLPSAMEVMRKKVSNLKSTFLVTLSYSEKGGLQLQGIKPQKVEVKEAAPGEETSDGEYLGIDPKSGKKVYVKVTAYGLLAQIGESNSNEKPKFARLRRGTSLEDVTLNEVIKLFQFPRTLGFFEGVDVVVGIGPYGPYVKHKDNYYNLSREDDPSTIEYNRAVEIIKTKRDLGIGAIVLEFEQDPNLRVINGRFGPYIKYKKTNYKIPKNMTPSLLTYEDCLAIMNDPANEAQKWTPRKKN